MAGQPPCAFQGCQQEGSNLLRTYKIKQARLTTQTPLKSNDQNVNVCDYHAELVDRDRSCCVEGCPIVTSEFSLPAVLHRPLPFRLKEDTPHRFLCLGHNLRYIDTLRKPMAASAVSEAIKKEEEAKSKQDNNNNNNNNDKKEGGGDHENAGSSPTATIIDDVVFVDAEKV